jgi:hypothetical protein
LESSAGNGFPAAAFAFAHSAIFNARLDTGCAAVGVFSATGANAGVGAGICAETAVSVFVVFAATAAADLCVVAGAVTGEVAKELGAAGRESVRDTGSDLKPNPICHTTSADTAATATAPIVRATILFIPLPPLRLSVLILDNLQSAGATRAATGTTSTTSAGAGGAAITTAAGDGARCDDVRGSSAAPSSRCHAMWV